MKDRTEELLKKEITFKKCNYYNNHKCFEALLNSVCFIENAQINVQINEKPNTSFSFESSTDQVLHWMPNFADKNPFFHSQSQLLAQEEILALEHPALHVIQGDLKEHVAAQNDGSSIGLSLTDVMLFRNVPRLGVLNTSLPISTGAKTIYGNYFKNATTKDVDTCLERLEQPTFSNIFSIAAPQYTKVDQLYSYKDLQGIFFTLCTAFRAIKEESAGKKAVIHTGNWGVGAFGNDAKTIYLLQLAAAEFCQVEEIILYPREKLNDLKAAQTWLGELKTQLPNQTVDQFLQHLADHAEKHNLRWREGNGT